MAAIALTLCLWFGPPIGAMQALDAPALFDRGVTWDAFLAGAQSQPATWQTNAARAAVAPDVVERFRKAATGLTLLVVAEAACSDSVQTLPYVAKLAALAGVPMRIIGKEAGKVILEAHRSPDDRAATPTIVLLRDGRISAAWVERPVTLQTWMIGPAKSLTQQERMSRKTAWYDWDRGDSTVAEVVALAEKK